jgi:hypothetical protein
MHAISANTEEWSKNSTTQLSNFNIRMCSSTFLRNECTASIFGVEKLARQETCTQKVAWSHLMLSGYMFKYHFHLEDGSSTLLPTVNFF